MSSFDNQANQTPFPTPHSFHPILGRKNFSGIGRKHLGFTTFFSSLPLNQIPTKTSFSPLFPSKFSILSKVLPKKHNLKHSSSLTFNSCLISTLLHIYAFTWLGIHKHTWVLLCTLCSLIWMISWSCIHSHMIDHMLRCLLHVLIFICSHACLLLPWLVVEL